MAIAAYCSENDKRKTVAISLFLRVLPLDADSPALHIIH